MNENSGRIGRADRLPGRTLSWTTNGILGALEHRENGRILTYLAIFLGRKENAEATLASALRVNFRINVAR